MPLNKVLSVLLLSIIMLVSASCMRRPVAFEFQSTPIEGWETGDTLHYCIDSLHHGGNYRLQIGLRTSAATPYPFQSIWLVVRQHWHNPDTLVIDTMEFKLTNSKGDVAGSGISLYSYTQELGHLQLEEGSSAEVKIMHIMRREMIRGIVDVGIRLDKID